MVAMMRKITQISKNIPFLCYPKSIDKFYVVTINIYREMFGLNKDITQSIRTYGKDMPHKGEGKTLVDNTMASKRFLNFVFKYTCLRYIHKKLIKISKS